MIVRHAPVLLTAFTVITALSQVPRTFHNFAPNIAATPYDVQADQGVMPQNVPPASISYVPVQAQAPVSAGQVQPSLTFAPPAPYPQGPPQMPAPQPQFPIHQPLLHPSSNYGPRPGPKPNGHMQAMMGLVDANQQVAPSAEAAQRSLNAQVNAAQIPQQTYSSAEDDLEQKRQREAEAEKERRKMALEQQKAKIAEKQRLLELQRKHEEEQLIQQQLAYQHQLQFQQQQQQLQHQHQQMILQQQQAAQQVSYFTASPSQPVESTTTPQQPEQPAAQPEVQTGKHQQPQQTYQPEARHEPHPASLSQMTNEQLEQYAQRLRAQVQQEKRKQAVGSIMAEPGLPVQTMATTAGPVTQPLSSVDLEPNSFTLVTPAPAPLPPPVGTPQIPPKNTHDVNYCDRSQFSDEELDDLKLKRMDYFIYNTSCSGIFFQCAIGQTFVLRCPSVDAQAFDPAISSCNFKNSVRFCPEYDHVLHCTIRETCTADQFACCALPQKCIEYSRRCDGHRDCADGDDENNCPSCAKDEFACVKSGICIPAKQRCDGKPDDCGDGTNLDEMGCSKNETCWGKFVCDSPATIAQVGHSTCIDFEKHCDKTQDCAGGEDELNCRVNEAKYLSCENQKQTVRKEQWCDGREDCADGSDEKYCF